MDIEEPSQPKIVFELKDDFEPVLSRKDKRKVKQQEQARQQQFPRPPGTTSVISSGTSQEPFQLLPFIDETPNFTSAASKEKKKMANSKKDQHQSKSAKNSNASTSHTKSTITESGMDDQNNQQMINSDEQIPDQSTPKTNVIDINDDINIIGVKIPQIWKAMGKMKDREHARMFINKIITNAKSAVDIISYINIKKQIDNTTYHMITIKVSNENELKKLCELEFKLPEPAIEIFKFTPVENKIEKICEENSKTKDRTIQVVNIPIYMQNKELRAIFSRYGELEENGIHTKLKGIYTHAYITYKKEKSIEVFYKKWSIWALKEYLHVLPLNLSDEKRKERQQWCAKINGLPLGTTARDLQQFIEEIGGAICFIPKQPNNYKPLKYAYIYFFTQEDMEIAINNVYEFKRKQLEWSPPEDKSCHLCGYTNHLAKECDNKFTTERKNYTNHTVRDNKPKRPWNRFLSRPSQNCSQNWDESDMNEWGDEEEFFTDRELNNNNIKNGTAKGGSIHDKRANKNSNQADIVTIKTQINEIATLLKDFKEEQNNMKNEFSEIKQKFNTKPVNTGKQKQVTFNENNKRAKMDSSSSENDNNDTILKLQEKMDKQDSVQSTLFIVTHLGQSIFGDYKEM
ncbi:uncharacterized protein OCT59_002425 [Rhizophagus irregularis]|uniref:RRM domain-containing protein n=1 Tax=Rhizophagus irregularis (strain DAOM 197198w) TaxID=1432141 RepID=A0A015M9J5_RHIIW|nr:hypothetical protein RirG_151650 [Rhizophagus irregularis DAOM 197198w]UZO10847.1 hypothetical protein OCT59_002425 [Rhizophagus irregularis]